MINELSQSIETKVHGGDVRLRFTVGSGRISFEVYYDGELISVDLNQDEAGMLFQTLGMFLSSAR